MKTVPTALAAHIAGETTTLATCWRIVLKDATVLTFTDHDVDIIYNAETYLAQTGYAATDIADSDALNVDNLQVEGVISSPSITEEDLRIGRWDGATFEIFQVNYASPTDGALMLKTGTLGEVTLRRNTFTAELLGLTQAFQRTIGEVDSPTCRAQLGDTRCGVAVGGLTVTGTIDSVNDDEVTLYDAARVESGPSGGWAISDIQATGGREGYLFCTLSGASIVNLPTFAFGDIVTISDVVGTIDPSVNSVTRVSDVTSSGFYFPHTHTPWYGIGFVGYTSGGTVTPMIDSGYFDGGVITFTSGANDGLSAEVKSFVPGQISLHLPMPYPVAAGDTYSLTPGCDKSLATCKAKYSNVVNFRGEPYLPGIDKVLQTGR